TQTVKRTIPSKRQRCVFCGEGNTTARAPVLPHDEAVVFLLWLCQHKEKEKKTNIRMEQKYLLSKLREWSVAPPTVVAKEAPKWSTLFSALPPLPPFLTQQPPPSSSKSKAAPITLSPCPRGREKKGSRTRCGDVSRAATIGHGVSVS